eukprot:jgi/Mesvir1/17693/Mv07873-RA.1
MCHGRLTARHIRNTIRVSASHQCARSTRPSARPRPSAFLGHQLRSLPTNRGANCAARESPPRRWKMAARCEAAARGNNVSWENVIMLQGFNWESSKYKWYGILQSLAPEIGAAGFTDVWLPPPSSSVSREGYLPSQLYNLNSNYGNGDQLKSLINALHDNKVRAVCDIVINHRCGDKQDSRGVWSIFEGGTEDDRLDWGPWAIAGGDQFSDGTGARDTGEDYGAAPDIDHTNARVQKDLSEWMGWLKSDIGFDGWRFDFTKGYAAWAVALYCRNTNPAFAVGEYWTTCIYGGNGLEYNQDGHRQVLCDWVNGAEKRCTTFDFTTKGILQEAVRGQLWRLRDCNGKPPGLMGWWPSKAVTFLDNHDTGSTQGHWPFPGDKVMQGYAYILTHPGIPSVFYDHYFDWGLKGEIKNLIDVRKRNGIHADSPVKIIMAEGDCYVAHVGDGKLVVKLGDRMDMGAATPGSDYKAVAFGSGYCVWERK